MDGNAEKAAPGAGSLADSENASLASPPPPSLLPGLTRSLEFFFFRHRRRIVYVQATMFLVFAVLVAGPLVLGTSAEDAPALDNLASFAKAAVWGIWFPLAFLSVIFSGRSWCGLLCPMGAASEWANRIGPRLAIPRWVRWPGTPIVSFLVVTIWAQTAGARDHAQAMAIVFGTTLAAAVVLGFFFGRGKRAWCRHMCPIGLLLGVYSRIGMVDFRPKRPTAGGERWTEKTACPTMIDLPRKSESRHCITCFRCVSPNAGGGLSLRLRPPGQEVAAIGDHNPNLSEVVFIFAGTGAAVGGFLWLVLDSYQHLRRLVGDWVIDQGWYWLGNPGPVWLMAVYPEQREVFRWLDFWMISGYMLAWTLIMTLVLGAATAAGAWLATRLGGGEESFRRRFVELGYQYLPVAMVSLLIGLGGKLFVGLEALGLAPAAVEYLKAALFLVGGAASLWLGLSIVARQGVAGPGRWAAAIPGLLGSAFVGAAWYPAVFMT